MDNEFYNWLIEFLDGKLTKEQMKKVNEKCLQHNIVKLNEIPPFKFNPNGFFKNLDLSKLYFNECSVDGILCDYPNPWHGVELPNCKKCGKKGSKINENGI